MYIVSSFEHTVQLETALTAVEMQGIPKDNILAVPLDKRNSERMLFDRLHSSDNLSMLDLPMISGATFALFGFIYGFILPWGPIIWALLGTAFGVGAGILIKLIISKRKMKIKAMKKTTEVFVLIACKDEQAQFVQDTLWAYSAMGVAKLDLE